MERPTAIAHIDLDAFYAQVETKLRPELKGKPVVVVQYNPWGNLETVRAEDDRLFNDSNGSIIAVSYEARAFGVKRSVGTACLHDVPAQGDACRWLHTCMPACMPALRRLALTYFSS
jgi:nucleotidyltransferase/DNA polymerase involved in DNA repair